MNQIITLSNGEMTETQAEAIKLHQSIMLNAEMAASSVVAMCRDLKAMRDRRLYEELGYSEFAEYTEKLVGIKARQAYNYISTYERLGDTVLQSNANLGITKLGLIAQMSAEDRAEMLESGAAEDMSVAEIKRLVEENRNQGEQLKLLEAEIEELKERDVEDAESDSKDEQKGEKLTEEEYEEELRLIEKQYEDELQSRKDEVEELKKELRSIKADSEVDRKQLRSEIEKKLKKNHEKQLESERKKAHEAGKKEAENEAAEKVELLKKQVEQSEQHSAQLQKELELSDSSSAEAKVYINSIQADFNALMEVVGKMDEEQGNKFRTAVIKLCSVIKEACEK